MKPWLIGVAFLCAFPLLAQDAATNDRQQILDVAKAFIVDLNLGDVEKLPALGRPEDAPPQPSGAAAQGMMKLKDLPQLAPLRDDLAHQAVQALAFSAPEIAADGQTAKVTMSTVAAQLRGFMETKLTYDLYLREAWRAQQAGQALPTLDAIKAVVKGAILQRGLDAKVVLMSKQTPPLLTFTKTPQGWRLNLKDFFGQKG